MELALLLVRDPVSRNFAIPRLGQVLFAVYHRLFGRPLQRRPVSIIRLLSKVPVVRCRVVRRGKFSQHFGEKDLERIKGFQLDFILRFGFGILRGEILNASRYGVWSFHHDDEEKYRGLPPGLWEIYKNDYVTGAVLQRLTGRLDAGVVLKKGYFKTIRHSYSKNLDQVLSESARWPAQVCIDIQNGNADYLNSPPSNTRARIFQRPNNRETCFFALKLVKRHLELGYRLFFRHTVWNVGIIRSPIQTFLTPGFKPQVQWLPRTTKGQIWADPFGRATGGRVQVLFEKLDYHQRKGIICTAEIEQGTSPTEPKVVIELPMHMSYPYIFEYKGETYCVPETNQAREVSVYKAEEFPYRWKKISSLLKNVRAIDTTIFQYDGRWWMTFTDRDGGGDANLYVWYAPDLWGPWTSHPLNPVKSDIRSSRPGGTPFEHGGHLYRPAQDCSRTGGGRIMINRVDRLTPTRFREEAVSAIEPDPAGTYRAGLHTLSAADGWTLIDGKQFRFVPSALRSNLAKGFARMRRRRSEQALQDI